MTENEGIERRRFGRIDLDTPLTGMVGDIPVEVVEVSLVGFRIRHFVRFPPGQDREIFVWWQGKEMQFACHIVRSTLFYLARTAEEKSVYQSGVRIEQAVGSSETVLRDFIASRVLRALEEQKANARGVLPAQRYTYQVGKGNRYRRCEFTDGKWRKFETTRADQPPDGFTVSAEVTPQQLDILCATYEETTAEGRRLTRMLAELSIRKEEGTPTRRYVP